MNPHSSLPSPPSHTHTNSIPLGSLSMSRDNTTPLGFLCVHRDVPTIQLGPLCVHRVEPSHQPPIKLPPTTFLPHTRFYVFILHILFIQHNRVRDSTAQRVCSPGAGFNPPEKFSPYGLPVSCCLAVTVVQSHETCIHTVPSRDLGVRGASIVRCGPSCLVDLSLDLYHLCGSLHGPDTFWVRGLS